jgi:hypothetical protein
VSACFAVVAARWQHGSRTMLARLDYKLERNCADDFKLSEPPDYQRAHPSTFVRVSLTLIANATGPRHAPWILPTDSLD